MDLLLWLGSTACSPLTCKGYWIELHVSLHGFTYVPVAVPGAPPSQWRWYGKMADIMGHQPIAKGVEVELKAVVDDRPPSKSSETSSGSSSSQTRKRQALDSLRFVIHIIHGMTVWQR